jgi:hypothetical protein
MASMLLLIGARPAVANLTVTTVTNPDGTFTYSYIVDNSSGSFDISILSLDLPIATPDWDQLDQFSGGDVAVPDSNWFASAGIPVFGNSAQDFLSLDPSSDIGVGEVLGGFSFSSAFAPGQVWFHEFSALGDSTSGFTVGPVAIPEGETWLTMMLVIGAIPYLVRRRKPDATMKWRGVVC